MSKQHYSKSFKEYLAQLEKDYRSMYNTCAVETKLSNVKKDMDNIINHNKYLINTLGEMKYEIIEHPIYNNDILDKGLNVRKLDVITLKNMINILKENRMLCLGKYDFFRDDGKLYIHNGECNLDDLQTIISYMNIFSSNILWIKVDGLTDSKGTVYKYDAEVITKYFCKDEIRFYIYNNMKIPRVRFLYDDGYMDRILESKMDNPFVSKWISTNVKKKAAEKIVTVDDIINDKFEDLCIKALEQVINMTSGRWDELITHFINFYLEGII